MKALLLITLISLFSVSSFASDLEMGQKEVLDMNLQIDQALEEEESMAQSVSDLTTEEVEELEAI